MSQRAILEPIAVACDRLVGGDTWPWASAGCPDAGFDQDWALCAHEVTAAKQPFAACGNLRPMEYKPCCDEMRRQLEFRCADHADLSECPDSLVVLRENPTRFGIRVHDGGSSSIAIRYCPWCGKSLQ